MTSITTRSLLLLFFVVVMCAPTPAAAQAAATHATTAPVIVAQGRHTMKVEPDQAWVSIAVDTRDTRAPEARRLSAVAMTSVQTALKGAGISADAARTTGFSVTPDYEYVNGRQRMRGFIVSNQLQVRIDAIDRVADVLDAVGSLTLASSSNLNITNLRFDLKDRAAAEREALRLATEDALARARAMAAGAGVQLGRVSRIDQFANDGFQQMEAMPMPAMAMAKAGDAMMSTPVSPSEVQIAAAVMVSVEILGVR
jgi:uncharacterized protein YggE